MVAGGSRSVEAVLHAAMIVSSSSSSSAGNEVGLVGAFSAESGVGLGPEVSRESVWWNGG